jgi:hypothetical protein
MVSGFGSAHGDDAMDNACEVQRDHLFISYATEDIAVAEWLTFRLTALGYRVWCDRIKLFGGESYPKDIDDAIKKRAFRFLALMSPASLTKPNPLKERTTAINVAEERKEAFIIPLNLGVKKMDLPWQLSDVTWVDFGRNMAIGLANLVKALEKANAPCAMTDGRRRVCSSVVLEGLSRDAEEEIYSNALEVKTIPGAITTFKWRREPVYYELPHLAKEWAFYRIDNETVLAFQDPPENVERRCSPRVVDASLWREREAICGVRARDIVSSLLQKSLVVHAIGSGLALEMESGRLYFPKGLLPGDKIPFTDARGKATHLFVVGEHGFFSPGKAKQRFRYHLSPRFNVRQDISGDFTVLINMGLHISDLDGTPMAPRAALARIKKITHDWWNREWLRAYPNNL